jgi:hypothetical protein
MWGPGRPVRAVHSTAFKEVRRCFDEQPGSRRYSALA